MAEFLGGYVSKVSIDGSYIKICLASLVENMSIEDKSIFFEDIVFEEKVIEMFTDFISSDYVFETCKWSNTYSSNKPIKRISDLVRSKYLESQSEILKTQVKNWQKDLDNLAKENHENLTKYWDLENKVKCSTNGSVFSLDGVKYKVQKLEEK